MRDGRRLPPRRARDGFDFEDGGHRYTAGVGRFEDGSLTEVFLNVPGRVGSTVEAMEGSATVASIALQYGVPTEIIRHALTRNTDGSASGPLGVALDLLR